MAAAGTFRLISIGDAVTEVSSGNVSREVVIDPVLDVDGVVTRNRGGGVQRIVVEAYRECGSFVERLGYVEGLYLQLGNEKGTLTVAHEDSEKSWTDCLLVKVEEVERAGAYVKFRCVFVRSCG